MPFDPLQIVRQSTAAHAEALQELAASAARSAPAPETGTLMGTSFAVVQDPLDELADSMEELSFQFEEKTMKRVADRKLGEMQGPRSAYARAVETWLALFPDLPSRDFLARLLRNLRQGGNATDSPRDLLRELARGSTDPSHQFALLDILEQALDPEESSLRDLVRASRELLQQAKGAEIRAGVNLAQEVNARASTPAEMQDLRDLYRSEVVGFSSPQNCFRSLLAARGGPALSDAISFLIAGCGTDLQSAAPSRSPEFLSRVLTDLQCVQVLQTVLDKLSALSARMPAQFGEACALSGEQLASRVLDLTEQSYVVAASIAALLSDCGMRKLLAQMDFTRELIALFRSLSPRLFTRESNRQQMVDAAQDHLDFLVLREAESSDSADSSDSA